MLSTFAILGAGLSLLITPLLGGFAWIERYFSLLLDVARATSDSSTVQPLLMENLRGFFTLLAAQYDPAVSGVGNSAWVLPLTALASAAVLAVLAVAWRRARLWSHDPPGWDARWAATIFAAVLVNP